MIGFDPTEDQKMMQGSVAQLAKTTLRARMREFERARAIPEDVRKAAHEIGLGAAVLPESVGGHGLGMVTAALLEEAVAYGDPAAAFGFGGAGSFGLCASELGTVAQAKRLIAPFVEESGHSRFGAVAWGEPRAHASRAGLVTTARRDGDAWVIDGEKAYVLNADRADVYAVFAQVDPSKGWSGVGAFVVEKGTTGLTIKERATTLGLDCASFGRVMLEGVRVKDEDRLDAELPGERSVPRSARACERFDAALVRFFVKNALLVAARGAGLSRAAHDITREYVETRKAFGKPIGHFQAVAFTLADRAMDLEASHAMVMRAASLWDALGTADGPKESEALLRSAYAISFVHEAAMRAGDDAVQLHGGSGFMRDYPLEKLMRDAKQLQLCGMTAEHADQLAAAIELGRPIDPGLVLPSAESQNAFV
jgi:alkylation response protein AidB-like acyl-CoA dehydrogenase